MTNTTASREAGAKSTRKLSKISTCGKWETFARWPGLCRYVPSGMFYIRFENAKHSLETTSFTTATEKLPAKKVDLKKPKAEIGTFADGCQKYIDETNSIPQNELSETSRLDRMWNLKRVRKSLAHLETVQANKITLQDLQVWANQFSNEFAPQTFNKAVQMLRAVLELAGLRKPEKSGELLDGQNPAWRIKLAGLPPKELKLPTQEEFADVVKEIRTAGARQSQDCADLVQFLAFTGCRVSEAAKVTWADVNFDDNELKAPKAKRRQISNAATHKILPMVPALRSFLTLLYAQRTEKNSGQNPQPTETICKVKECQKSLTRACKLVGCARLTHHGFRHLFATFCIEAGIDIPTVSRWLGHSDGGALAMRTYGHLRTEHSQAMAAKVTFGVAVLPALPPVVEAVPA